MSTACPRCGHDNADDALLCGTCRAYLGWARRPEARATDAPRATAPDASPPPPPAAPAEPDAAAPAAPAAATPAARRPVAPPAPIAVPRDVAGAPRAVQVPASGSRRAPRPDTPPPDRPRAPAPPAASATPSDGAGRSTWTPPAPTAAAAPAAPPAPARGDASGGPAPVQVSLGPSAPRTARPGARSAPPRTIGVRVAAGPSRIEPQRPAGPDAEAPARTSSFEALQPTAAQDEPTGGAGPSTGPARPGAATGSVPVFEDAVRCPSCGRALPASRRFCRCGATLAPPSTLVVDDAPEPVPWYRRAAGAGASFRRRMRTANHGTRVVFDRGRAAQVHVTRATAALAAVGLAGVVVLPQASDVRDRAFAAVQQVDPRGYTRVVGVTATTDPPPADPAAPADPVFGAPNAVDGATGRAWSAPWTPPADAGPPCQRPGGAPALVLTLPAPTDVDRVGLVVGLPESAPDRARQAVPALVDVTWLPSGRCTTLELTDAATLQTQDVADVRGATSARVVVVDAHLPQDPPTDLRVAVGEVVLLAHGRLGSG
ncbi:zinc ribbon domain-containing protein [Cellulomonas sp. Sa3CUA2]|uniref:Zinc ribbon domain-containing protein n=1 Tax=Cellulomonas avistercoris TaxID=2762242 RepID=A0ABR8QDQ7_9CELL|nr:zinc ribbon domain-containing protein [Cellulomonas avistercoris]MBD7918561.1 zinc ribbon domain-containing protein [Cellulomonas avistercoris]